MQEIVYSIIIILLIIIIYCIYDVVRFDIIINYLVDDIEATYGKSFNKNTIKKEIYIKYGALRKLLKFRSIFKCDLTNVLYRRSKGEKLSYLYCIIGALSTYSDNFSYELFDYCEKRIVASTEHHRMRICLNAVVLELLKEHGHYQYFSKELGFLCQELIKIDFPEYHGERTVSLNRMINYIEDIRNFCANYYTDYISKDISKLCDLYISEIKNQWERLS